MAVDIKQSLRRLFDEAWGKGNLDVFDEILDSAYRGHDPVNGDSDRAGVREMCRMYRAAFPDLSCTVLGAFADHDAAILHWRMTGTHRGPLMGIAPTGARCTAEGINVARFRGGKIVEDWAQWDALGLMRQLGVAPAPQPGVGARAPENQPQPHA